MTQFGSSFELGVHDFKIQEIEISGSIQTFDSIFFFHYYFLKFLFIQIQLFKNIIAFIFENIN